MYKMNILLKIFITLLIITIVVITNNKIILWLLLFIMSLYHLNKYKLLLIIDLLLVVLLGLSVNYDACLLLFKIIFLADYFISFYKKLSIDDKKILFRKKTTSKMMYYEDNFDKIINKINDNKNRLYNKDVLIDKKVEEDLARSYLQARIRFYGTSYKNKKKIKWNKIDTLILLLSIIIFLIFFLLR